MVLLFAGSPAAAQPVGALPSQWSVRSTYFDPMAGQWGNDVRWTYRLDGEGDGIVLAVSDDSQHLDLSAQMIFNAGGSLVQVTRDSRMGTQRYRLQRVFAADKPAIVEDAMVPCNWLNRPSPWEVVAPQDYNVTEVVSEKNRFVSQIRVTSKAIPAADAVARGMITMDTAALLASQPLTLVTAAKLKPGRPERTILVQLWAPGHFFWLYEETPSRRSYFSVE